MSEITIKLVPDKLVAYLLGKPLWKALACWLYLWRVDLCSYSYWLGFEVVSDEEKLKLFEVGLPVTEIRATKRRRGFQLSLTTPYLAMCWCYHFQCWDRRRAETSLWVAWKHVKGWRVGDGEEVFLRERRWVWWKENLGSLIAREGVRYGIE
jgi:hypothetical protein